VSHFRLLVCDFCGSSRGLRSYPIDIQGLQWHACAVCVRLVRSEDWNNLIERIIAAFTALQHIPVREQIEFRHELAKAFQRTSITETPYQEKTQLFL
jgi:hypothetical protein